MKLCSVCQDKSVFSSYCKQHFLTYIESKVKHTIETFHLIKSDDKIAVAVSGGKDSQSVLYILHKLYGNIVHAIAIDEGIPEYRDKTLRDMQTFCDQYGIPLNVYSFDSRYGRSLSSLLDRGATACRSCGVLRRHLINEASKDYDKLVTGHNLDDECQSIIMNLLKGTTFLSAKLGPYSGVRLYDGFTQRIKPLYFCTEKEIAAYAFISKFPVRFTECPHAPLSFRSVVRDALNELENDKPGTKKNIADKFTILLPSLKALFSDGTSPNICASCGSPAAGKKCKACQTLILYAN
jgi:uncharacterized protein (TIGR00269 family)